MFFYHIQPVAALSFSDFIFISMVCGFGKKFLHKKAILAAMHIIVLAIAIIYNRQTECKILVKF